MFYEGLFLMDRHVFSESWEWKKDNIKTVWDVSCGYSTSIKIRPLNTVLLTKLILHKYVFQTCDYVIVFYCVLQVNG